eukprot:TRINITY_DN3292_c0_g1_i1.p1 TRINITY_DN3292_c0_g1~~TRINITY_DN3292_c0_g1_i1.p1  ORF type:complete len:379 (-),score=96.97 TRINITY_DN3292_c0_g1_i1:174-1310(-)
MASSGSLSTTTPTTTTTTTTTSRSMPTSNEEGFIKIRCPAKFQSVFQEYFDNPQLAQTIKLLDKGVMFFKHADRSYKLCLICGYGNTTKRFWSSCPGKNHVKASNKRQHEDDNDMEMSESSPSSNIASPPSSPPSANPSPTPPPQPTITTITTTTPTTTSADVDLMVAYLKENMYSKFESLYDKFKSARNEFVQKAKTELQITDTSYFPFQVHYWDPQRDTSILDACSGQNRRPEVQQLAEKVRSLGRRYLTSFFGLANRVSTQEDRNRFEERYCSEATNVFCFILPLDTANYIGAVCGLPAIVRNLKSWAVIGDTQRHHKEAFFTNFIAMYNDTQKFSRDAYPDNFQKLEWVLSGQLQVQPVNLLEVTLLADQTTNL